MAEPSPTRDPVVRLPVTHLRRGVWVLVGTAVALGLLRELVVAVVGLDSPLGMLRPFNVDDEASVPTWIATTLLLSGAVAWGATALARRGEPVGRVAAGVAVVMLLASVDEGSSLHETVREPLRDGLGLGGALQFAWVLVGAPILVGLVVALLRVRDRLPADVARTLLVGAVVFGLGAVGMEVVGGQVAETAGRESIAWGISTVVEESLELVGAGLAVVAGLVLWSRAAPRVRLDVSDG